MVKMRRIIKIFVVMVIFTLAYISFKYFVFKEIYEKPKVYILSLYYNSSYPKKLQLINITIEDGYAPGRKIQPDKGYILRVLSNKKILHEFKFEIPNKMHYDYIDKETKELKGGYIELDNLEFTLVIPYFRDGREIDILEQGNIILSVDISRFMS
jgi:hypothetical protein